MRTILYNFSNPKINNNQAIQEFLKVFVLVPHDRLLKKIAAPSVDQIIYAMCEIYSSIKLFALKQPVILTSVLTNSLIFGTNS
jgi:hypothetical protein